jgi:hypothetical protein
MKQVTAKRELDHACEQTRNESIKEKSFELIPIWNPAA